MISIAEKHAERSRRRDRKKTFIYHLSGKFGDSKVLFTDRYTWQNFRLQFLRLVNRLRSDSQDPKIKTKVLPCVTVGE